MITSYPTVLASVRAEREFLGRAVSYLAGEAGIWQFLDIGTGLPSAGNTHEASPGPYTCRRAGGRVHLHYACPLHCCVE